MKLKHISALFFLLFVFSFTGFSQVEDEEVQMFSFSSTRGIGMQNLHDFGMIKDTPGTFLIELQNTGKTDLKVGKIMIPEGVGVTVMKEVLKPGEKGGLVVTIDPKYMEKGEFKKQVVISTLTQNEKGTVIRKTAAYNLKGQIL
ncbi:MAG: DUF1573 domain-containing protein [Bacteroidales bacterium]|nr:DUF1573 domain-containing protein [Bacteroidales bacterium]